MVVIEIVCLDFDCENQIAIFIVYYKIELNQLPSQIFCQVSTTKEPQQNKSKELKG